MIIVLEKDRTVILNKDGSIKKIISIAEESYYEDELLEEQEENDNCINHKKLSKVI